MADITVKTPVRQAAVAPRGFVLEKLVEIDTDVYARGVAIVGADTPIDLTGDVVVDTLGALDDSAETDPDSASATIPALMRGSLAQLLASVTALQSLAGVVSSIAKANSLQVGVFHGGGVVNPAHEETLQTVSTQLADAVTALQSLAGVVSSIAKSNSLQVGVFHGGGVVNPAHEETLQDIRDAIGRGDDSAGDPTVIGQLKQIAANTAG